MAKGKKQQSKEPTKKQLAFSRREREQRNRILIGVGIVVAVILGIALAGLYDQLFSMVDNPDLVRVFTALQSASQDQHLPAFERCAP